MYIDNSEREFFSNYIYSYYFNIVFYLEVDILMGSFEFFEFIVCVSGVIWWFENVILMGIKGNVLCISELFDDVIFLLWLFKYDDSSILYIDFFEIMNFVII